MTTKGIGPYMEASGNGPTVGELVEPKAKLDPVKANIDKKIARLSPKHTVFLKSYFTNGYNGTEAYLAAGYKVKNRNVAAVQASLLLRTPKIREIMDLRVEEARNIIRAAAPEAARVLDKVMGDTHQSGATKVSAAKEVLTIAGVTPAIAESTINIVLAGEIDEWAT